MANVYGTFGSTGSAPLSGYDYHQGVGNYGTNIKDFFLTTWHNVTNGAQGFWHWAGAVVGAVIILLVGLAIAAILRYIVIWVLTRLRIGAYAKRYELNRFFNITYDWKPLLGDLIWWGVVISFLLAAMDVVNLSSYFIVNRFLNYLPAAFLGGVTVFVGVVFANLLARVSMAVADWLSVGSAYVVGWVVRAAVLVVTAVFAMYVFQIDGTWINDIILAGISAFGLAAGLAFGLGGGLGRESVFGGILSRWFRREK